MFFILGMPRSGTKLLRTILSQHSRIAISDIETDFFSFLVARMQAIGDCSDPRAFGRLYREMLSQPFFVFLGDRDAVPAQARWYEACAGFTPAGVFEGLLRVVTGTCGDANALLGDKSPAYINQLDVIREHFPAARYVHIVRDVRDYCLSIRKAWGKNMLRAAQKWAESLEAVQPHFQALGDRLTEVRYEDLLGDPEAQIRRICAGLGVPFEEQMIVLQRATENLGDTKGESTIVAGNTGKYREMLSDRELAALERLSCNMLRHYGYELSWSGDQQSLGAVQQRYLQLLDGLNLVRSTVSERGIVGSILFHWNHFRATRA